MSELDATSEWPDAFGDWETEYRALVEACAWTLRDDRAVLRVHGDRAAEMLNGILTQEVRSLTRGRPALLLSPKGRVLADLRIFPGSDELWVVAPRAALETVLSVFGKYLPPIYARFEDVSRSVRLLGVYGPGAVEAVTAALGAPIPDEPLGIEVRSGPGAPLLLIRDRRMAGEGVELLARADALPEIRRAIDAAVRERGGRAAGRRALEVVRVESGIPAYGLDIGEENLAQETGLHEALSFDKGCYLGQEVVARIHFRGHVNRHLRGLRFREGPPAPGTELFSGDRTVGRVTSAVRSPDLGPIGLGYVRREVEPPASLVWHPAEDAESGLEVIELPVRQRFEVAEGHD